MENHDMYWPEGELLSSETIVELWRNPRWALNLIFQSLDLKGTLISTDPKGFKRNASMQRQGLEVTLQEFAGVFSDGTLLPEQKEFITTVDLGSSRRPQNLYLSYQPVQEEDGASNRIPYASDEPQTPGKRISLCLSWEEKHPFIYLGQVSESGFDYWCFPSVARLCDDAHTQKLHCELMTDIQLLLERMNSAMNLPEAAQSANVLLFLSQQIQAFQTIYCTFFDSRCRIRPFLVFWERNFECFLRQVKNCADLKGYFFRHFPDMEKFSRDLEQEKMITDCLPRRNRQWISQYVNAVSKGIAEKFETKLDVQPLF